MANSKVLQRKLNAIKKELRTSFCVFVEKDGYVSGMYHCVDPDGVELCDAIAAILEKEPKLIAVLETAVKVAKKQRENVN